jgi:hypothetical protein
VRQSHQRFHLSCKLFQKAPRSTTEEEDHEKLSIYLWPFCTRMRQDLLLRTLFLLGSNTGIWKQARELVSISEPKSTSTLFA